MDPEPEPLPDELELEGLEEPWPDDVEPLPPPPPPPLLLLVGAAQDSETLAIGTLTGSEMEEIGVPGGTLTVNVSVCPVTVLTVITQVCAEATGIEASAITTRVVTTAMDPTNSFRLLNTEADVLPQLQIAQRRYAAPERGVNRSY